MKGSSISNASEVEVLPAAKPKEQNTRPAILTIGAASQQVAPAELLGVNLEMTSATNEGMLSNRLRNPKFCGPPNLQTGLAPEWQPIGNNLGSFYLQLVPGMFLSGDESQLVNNYAGNGGFLQTGIYLAANEELELEIWAKVRHHPVKIDIQLTAHPSRATAYCRESITVDTAYWKRYTTRLHCPSEDHNATFFLFVMEEGVVLFDQIHLRPVGSPHLHEGVIARMAEMQIPVMRFPGGCMSTNYHWKLGTGPVHLRPCLPDPVFKLRTGYDFGTDEYLETCHQQGIRPYITVNIGSGTPEDAAAWAKYCVDWYRKRELPLPRAYFQMGNEQYGRWESSHMNAPMFLEALQTFVPAIRENFPGAVIVGPAEPQCGGGAGAPETELRELVLKEARGLVDVLAINRYKGQWFETPEDKIVNAVESVGKIEADFLQLIEDCQRHGWENPRLALPEWNYWLHASHWDGNNFYEPDDAQHALFVSGMFHMMARMAPFIELAAFEHLIIGMGLLQNHGGRVSVTSISEIFRLYRPAFPGEVVEVEADCGELPGGFPMLDVLATRRDGRLWVFVCNRSWQEEVTFRIDGANERLLESRLFAAKDWSSPMREQSFRSGTLPPLSLARLCYESRV